MSYTSIIKSYKVKKTFSQKVALLFAFVNALLLIPATEESVIILSSAGYVFFIVFIILFFIYALGIMMLIGYIKHARGNLSQEKVWGLWICTILCNFSALIVTRWAILRGWFENRFMVKFSEMEFWQQIDTILYMGWMLWLIVSCSLAFLSLYKDEIDYKKTRNSSNAP